MAATLRLYCGTRLVSNTMRPTFSSISLGNKYMLVPFNAVQDDESLLLLENHINTGATFREVGRCYRRLDTYYRGEQTAFSANISLIETYESTKVLNKLRVNPGNGVLREYDLELYRGLLDVHDIGKPVMVTLPNGTMRHGTVQLVNAMFAELYGVLCVVNAVGQPMFTQAELSEGLLLTSRPVPGSTVLDVYGFVNGCSSIQPYTIVTPLWLTLKYHFGEGLFLCDETHDSGFSSCRP